MGKKKAEEMAKQRSVFVDGAPAAGVPLGLRDHIFDLMEKFAGYGFNKSHSVAYAVLAYQTAWLKAHYPAPFMAAVLSSDMEHTDKVVHSSTPAARWGCGRAARRQPLALRVRRVRRRRDPLRLGAITRRRRGRSRGADRRARGARRIPFARELCQRADLQRANRRVLEALHPRGRARHDRSESRDAHGAAAGGDPHGRARRRARARRAGRHVRRCGGPAVTVAAAEQVLLPEWSESERLAGERDTLGLYLTGHPVRRLRRTS
jgi:DNA polymerase-3 subunit alpha